jgi:type I restriction enzyme S subunit
MTDEDGVEDVSLLLRTDPDIAAAYARSTIATGDLVISIGPSFGKVMACPPELAGANLTQGTARVAVRPPAVPRFVFWALRSTTCFQHWESSVGGATFRALNLGPLAETPVPMPAPRTQYAIADYLDRVTARLDALIAAKERVLGLLTEKRRALITRAVTRGLDPHAPLRDSGIPWLGQIPVHWDALPIKYGFARIGSGTTPPTVSAEYYDGDVPWVTTSELRENVVVRTTQSLTRLALEDLSSLRVYPVGSVLFAMYGATIGRVALLGIEATVNQAVCVLAEPRRFDAKFAFYALQASREHLIALASGGGQPNINAEKVRDHRLACPPISEQHTIVAHIEQETRKLAALSYATEGTIALLKERRAALIAAAVTGQIDLESAK